MPFDQIILRRRAHAGPVEHTIPRKSGETWSPRNEQSGWERPQGGRFQGLKLLLDDGHVIQEQVNSEKYQGTLVFVRHTDFDAG